MFRGLQCLRQIAVIEFPVTHWQLLWTQFPQVSVSLHPRILQNIQSLPTKYLRSLPSIIDSMTFPSITSTCTGINPRAPKSGHVKQLDFNCLSVCLRCPVLKQLYHCMFSCIALTTSGTLYVCDVRVHRSLRIHLHHRVDTAQKPLQAIQVSSYPKNCSTIAYAESVTRALGDHIVPSPSSFKITK